MGSQYFSCRRNTIVVEILPQVGQVFGRLARSSNKQDREESLELVAHATSLPVYFGMHLSARPARNKQERGGKKESKRKFGAGSSLNLGFGSLEWWVKFSSSIIKRYHFD